MNPKNDEWIAQMCEGDAPLISPFVARQIKDGVISYGLGGHGYDIRVADEFELFTKPTFLKRLWLFIIQFRPLRSWQRKTRSSNITVDPKNFDPQLLCKFEGPVCTIPPNSFALARSIEYMRMPRNVIGIVLGKSTYARCGIVTNFTPLEAGWEGHITIEISNTTPLLARIYANEGIAQVLFFESEPASVPYGDRPGGGKYQAQRGITKARV